MNAHKATWLMEIGVLRGHGSSLPQGLKDHAIPGRGEGAPAGHAGGAVRWGWHRPTRCRRSRDRVQRTASEGRRAAGQLRMVSALNVGREDMIGA